MRFRTSRILPTSSRLLLVAAILLCASTAALADGTVPNVVGQSESEAVDQLEALGLRVGVVTIAGVSPGRVASQAPAAGAPYADGDEVELRVGVRLTIMTRAPRVIGKRERRVIADLEGAYYLEVQYVSGPRGMQGRVIAQDPAEGADVPYRGVFRVRVVRNRVTVPLLVGRSQAAAEQLLTDVGLSMQARYATTQFATAGTVIGQEPRADANILPGGTVEVTVAGRPSGGGLQVTVPSVVGLAMHDAENEVLAHGLVPHVHFRAAPAGTPGWSVLSQEVVAGRRVPEGSHLGFDVARPGSMTDGIRMPTLYGLEKADMLDLLQHMGLSATLGEQPSSRPAGTVLGQTPAPGVTVRRGATVQAILATPPPSGWTPPVRIVPNVDGMRPVEAHLRLLAAGFRPRMRHDTGAGEPVDRVFRQDPRAGLRKAVGTSVIYYVPYRATVPNLSGMTRTQAINALHAASLQALVERIGPAIRGGISEVVWQQHAAGSVIARNTLVRLRYRMRPAVTPLRPVPNVVGLTKAAASARLTAAGFSPVLRAVSIGIGTTRVISQTPVAGSLRPAGHSVEARYRYVGPVPIPLVTVPRVIGMTRNDGKARLEGLGFTVRTVRSGPAGLGAVRTEIIAQSPLAGTRMVRGSRITITYRVRPIVAVRVRVPNVVGMRVDRAIDKLRRAGLSWTRSGIGSRVRSQTPSAGARVLPGTSVRLRLRL